MEVDKVPSYLNGLTVNVPRYIPTFPQACQAQLDDSALFDQCIFTRTFVAFGPERNKFRLYTLEDVALLRQMPIVDGFPTIPEATYASIPLSQEFTLDERGILDIQASFDGASHGFLTRLLPGNAGLRSRVEYLERKFSVEKRGPDQKLPIAWIQRLGPATTPYLAPLRVGTKDYYIAVGEDRITGRIEDEQFSFLPLTREPKKPY